MTKEFIVVGNDNLLLLMSDGSGSKMKIYNYNFDGSLKTNYPLEYSDSDDTTPNYNNNQNILDILVLTNNKFVIVTTDTSGDLVYDIYTDNGSGIGKPSQPPFKQM